MRIAGHLRSDFTGGLIHLTRQRIGKRRHWEPLTADNAYEKTIIAPLYVLKEILEDGVLRGSNNSGFIKGTRPAVCLTETPLSSVRFLQSTRYSYYGLAISKRAAFTVGARPVIYLPDHEAGWIPEDQKWRHVRFESGVVDFTHEREWRIPGDLYLNTLPGFYVLIWNPGEIDTLHDAGQQYSNLRGYLPMNHLIEML